MVALRLVGSTTEIRRLLLFSIRSYRVGRMKVSFLPRCVVSLCAAACSLCCLLVSKLVASGAGAWGVAQAVASMAASAAARRLLFIEQDLRIGIALVMVTE